MALSRRLLPLVLCLTLAACARVTPSQQAALLADKGQVDAAIALLQRHLNEQPDAIAEHRLLIRLLGSAGRLRDATRQAEALDARLHHRSPLPWIDLGHAHELAHRYDEALALYDKAARVAPSDPRGARAGGVRAAHWGELESAAPRLREALRRDPRDSETWHVLGLVLVHLGDLHAAESAYRAGLRADPHALQNRVGLATLALLRDDPATALAEYDAILEARPRHPDAQLGRSWALLKLGRLDEAQAALDQAAKRGADARVIQRQRALLNAARARGRTP